MNRYDKRMSPEMTKIAKMASMASQGPRPTPLQDVDAAPLDDVQVEGCQEHVLA
jgi:hypothetical protein